MSRAARHLVFRGLVSLSLLAVLAVVLDVGEVADRLAALRPGWVALALAVSVVQVAASAWRWRFTARRLDLDLPPDRAVAEYYLATFLNQVLPGGVLGDVSRAWRHARGQTVHDGRTGGHQRASRVGDDGRSGTDGRTDDAIRRLRSVHAVILERVSGQAVMIAVAAVAASAVLLPRPESTASTLTSHPLSDVPPGVWAPVAVAAGIAALVVVRRGLRRLMRLPALDRFVAHARAALLGRALPVQAAVSLLVVGSYVVLFVVAARAVGVATPSSVLAPLVPLLLVTMLVPVSVAGWGVREGAAALLWSAVGLTATEGVAVSVAYGLLVLVSSLPGAVVLLLTLRRTGDPDRRGDPGRGGSAVPEAVAPRRASRSAGGRGTADPTR